MKLRHLLHVSLLVSAFATQCRDAEGFIEPVFSAFSKAYNMGSCVFGECCYSSLKYNQTGLLKALSKRLHGQPLVMNTVVRLLTRHIENDDPQKALVLSFHGSPGSGKNFVSRLIAEHVYEQGLNSRFVHFSMSTLHFPHHDTDRIAGYQDNLRNWIRGNVSVCERTMFIFDEMDKMPNGLLDAIKPYLDTYLHINGVNYRKAIFLFLSNTAGSLINQRVLEHWEAGGKREDLTRKEMEDIISNSSYNISGGLWHSSLIKNGLISAFVPFLPLERHHVKQCVNDDLKLKGHHGVSVKEVNEILDELEYFPKNKNIFSTYGCKRVPQKVDLIID